MCIWIFQQSKIHLFIKNATISENGGLGGSFILGNASVINVLLTKTVFIHNKCGGSEIKILNVIPATNTILISSSLFANNTNGSLKLTLHTLSLTGGSSQVQLNNLVIIGNKGTFSQDPSVGSNSIGQGTGILLWFDSLNAYIEIAFCTILNNVGDTGSIVYIEDNTGNELEISRITIVSSQFTHNYGPALYLSNCNVEFEGYSSFSNNTAQSGSAIYLAHNSQATIDNNYNSLVTSHYYLVVLFMLTSHLTVFIMVLHSLTYQTIHLFFSVTIQLELLVIRCTLAYLNHATSLGIPLIINLLFIYHTNLPTFSYLIQSYLKYLHQLSKSIYVQQNVTILVDIIVT